MDLFSMLGSGFAVALDPLNLTLLLVGCFVGTMVGVLPGIGPINGVAILLPICYSMGLKPETAIIMLCGVYYGAEYGGRVSSILLNVPGDAGAVMTTMDGHPMARKGEGGRALALSGVASFVGGTIALVMLTIFAPMLSKLAVEFAPQDYVMLMLVAFACLTTLVGSRPVKTLIGAMIGLVMATVGIDGPTGVLRFTMDIPNLFDGIDFMIVVIGLFAVSEVLLMLEHVSKQGLKQTPVGRSFVSLRDLAAVKWTMLRSSLIGFFIGVLPGTGASIASAVTYGVERRLAKDSSQFGHGDPRGLAAPESANNASTAGALVPMLTLGIPGSGTTAILLGALLMFNVTPGPMMFEQRPEIAWGLIASMYLGNIALLVLNLPLVGLFARLLQIRQGYLVPLIVMLTFIGVYSIHGGTFDLVLMVVIGVFGYFLRKLDISLTPVILGLVLGGLFETNLRRALSISGGDWGVLFSTGYSQALFALAIAVMLFPLIMKLRNRRRDRAADASVTGKS